LVTAVDVSQTALDGIDLPATRCEKSSPILKTHLAPAYVSLMPWCGNQLYLWRALSKSLINSVAPGNVLIYRNLCPKTAGRLANPPRPDFFYSVAANSPFWKPGVVAYRGQL
jgi:hypothetical protein